MKDTNLFNTRHQYENEECECVARCECGKASDIYRAYANDYFPPTTILVSPDLDDFTVEEFNRLLETDEEFLALLSEEEEDEFIYDLAIPIVTGPFQTPEEIERRKSELKGTKYFHNEFAIANCHLVQVEVAFKNQTMKDIPNIIDYGTEGNFEILKLKDHSVEFLAHYEPEYYTQDDILNYLCKVFRNEIDSLLCISYL